MAQFYLQYEYWFAAMQLILAMLGMGATLTGKDFRDVVKEPRSVFLGTTIQLALVPIMAFLFLHLLGVTGGVAVGIAMIAAVPGGTTSNMFTYFSRGNSALSICITALTTLACLLTTPLILMLLIGAYLPQDFSMPRGQIVREIALTLLLPLAAGMAYLYFYPRTAATLSKWSIRGSLFGIILIVIGSASAGRLDVAAFGSHNLMLITLFTLCLALTAYVVPKTIGLSRSDSTAIEFEVIVRNVNLGVLIKASIFPAAVSATAQMGDTVLFSLLLYGGLQMLLGAILIWLYRRSRA